MSWPTISSWRSCRLQFSLEVPEHAPQSWWCAPYARGFRSHSFGSQWLCSLLAACMIPMAGLPRDDASARRWGVEDTCADYQRVKCWWALRRGLAVPTYQEKHITKYPLRTENYVFIFKSYVLDTFDTHIGPVSPYPAVLDTGNAPFLACQWFIDRNILSIDSIFNRNVGPGSIGKICLVLNHISI